jgi:exosome complex protein LRP1
MNISTLRLSTFILTHNEVKMTDVKDITPDLDRLDNQLDDLEEKLQPLLGNLEGMASQLPLLDKAKLFSLTAYAIESLMFCELSRNPHDAR